jgi:hypothetical protein
MESPINRILTEAQALRLIYGRGVYDVVTEGAKADATDDGGTDDTAACQAAEDRAWVDGGGIVIYPPGSYKFDGAVIARPNVRRIAYGVTIRKYGATLSTYSSFETKSNGAHGYGSGGRNMIFEGFTFQGKFGTGSGTTGNAVTLHHAQDVQFRNCHWVEAIRSGHALDLIGCKGIRVDANCTFEGFDVQPGREYVEAIQVDHSYAGAGGSDSDVSFDGLPTIDLVVQNSWFGPLTVDGVPYPGPNPLGSHSRVAGSWFDNITFQDNVVEDGIDTAAITDGFALLTRGWLHFFCARNVKVLRNTFRNTTGRAARVFGAYAISTGTPLANVTTRGFNSVGITPMPLTGFTFEDNTLDGFNSDALEDLVSVEGTDTLPARTLQIDKNTVTNSWKTPKVTADKGGNFVYLGNVSGVGMAENNLTDARTLAYGYKATNVRIRGGKLRDLGAFITRWSTSSNIIIDDLHVDGHGGGHWFYNGTTGMQVRGGSIVGGRADAIRKKHFSISGGTEWKIADVRMPKDSNGYTSAIDVYTTSSKGKIKDIFAAGWISDANLVSFGSGSTAEISGAVY